MHVLVGGHHEDETIAERGQESADFFDWRGFDPAGFGNTRQGGSDRSMGVFKGLQQHGFAGIPAGIAATVTSVNGVPPIATKTVTGPGTVVSVTASSTPGGWASATGSAYSYSSSSQTP